MNSYVMGNYVPSSALQYCYASESSNCRCTATVDVITILPTFLTFIIQMIGDTYPLPPGQVDFVKALQVLSTGH